MTDENLTVGNPDEPISEDFRKFVEEHLENPTAPRQIGPFILGSYYHINGEGACETTAQVSIFELELIAEYWAKEINGIEWRWMVLTESSSYSIRAGRYARSRLEYLEQVLGPERIEKILNKVDEERPIPTEEEAEAIQQEIFSEDW